MENGKLQQTLAGCIKLSGKTGQSGKVSKVKIWPGFTGQGRYFEFHSNLIPASIDFVRESLLCTSLCKDGYKIRTVEHLLSALEAKGIDNCRIQIQSLDSEDTEVEGLWDVENDNDGQQEGCVLRVISQF
ncbi:hypothetical protein ES332_D11G258700v1 [Gossypium tomentosum]|uniref:UDP-3-O-acyl-N-acetylglucosamine deacetylase n=1 Tax=Gossypium tomentosum TaxID=34277 RepID=A0A5D2IT96_GOSTO|nr:hypothetical protein ES332_D11G258700v1 [Gossypium tomentosum]